MMRGSFLKQLLRYSVALEQHGFHLAPITVNNHTQRSVVMPSHVVQQYTTLETPLDKSNDRASWSRMCSSSSTSQQSPPELQPDSQDILRERLLQAALKHVPQHGWSMAALHAAAVDLGYSPAAVGLVSNGPTGLVQYFVDQCNSKLALELSNMQDTLDSMRIRDRVVLGVRTRLEMVIPHIATWPQALSLQAHPAALPTSLVHLTTIVDTIWRAAGDTSTDSNWYTKRALLAGVYTATELYMLTDGSPGFADTWESLQRRVDDVVAVGKNMRQISGQLEGLLQAGNQMFMAALHKSARGDGTTRRAQGSTAEDKSPPNT